MDYLFKDYLLPSAKNTALREQYNIFLLENGLSEHADIIVHIESYTYGLSVTKYFDKRGYFASNPKDILLAMKSPICVETAHALLETIDDRFVPGGRDHIFQVFKEKIENNFKVRMSLDRLSKTAVYYILIHEIISGLRLQIQDNRTIYKQYDYKLAKLLASLWVAIVIPDDMISERIFQYFINAYEKWVLDDADQVIMAYIAFGGEQACPVICQKSSREESSEEQREESGKEQNKKTSKQQRQVANKLKKK